MCSVILGARLLEVGKTKQNSTVSPQRKVQTRKVNTGSKINGTGSELLRSSSPCFPELLSLFHVSLRAKHSKATTRKQKESRRIVGEKALSFPLGSKSGFTQRLTDIGDFSFLFWEKLAAASRKCFFIQEEM